MADGKGFPPFSTVTRVAMKISMPKRPADSRVDGSSNGEMMLAMALEDSETVKRQNPALTGFWSDDH